MIKKKDKLYRIRYATAHGKGVIVTLPFNPRKGKCEACGKIVGEEIKSTAMHHWYYSYKAVTVKANPILALENTSELCFYCHQLADAIRALLYANPTRVAWVVQCLKGEPKKRFIKVLEKTVEEVLKTETNISENAKRILRLAKSNGKN